MNRIFEKTYQLLKELIRTPSLSGNEDQTAILLEKFMIKEGYNPVRVRNNVMIRSKSFNNKYPSLLLCSHHDTVKPSSEWDMDPFGAEEIDGKLYGLGSNDAGGCLIALLSTFLYLDSLPGFNKNIVFIASAEEEISGKGNIETILKQAGKIYFGIVGEPTAMKLAIAEKGLMVIDFSASGISGHAAREIGDNAIYRAIKDIEKLRKLSFPRISPMLGEVKISVTQIRAGTNHNVIPAECSFVADVRSNELYTNQELFKKINRITESKAVPKSFRLSSTGIRENHKFVKNAIKMNIQVFGSQALSDQAFMKFPTVKIGPGNPSRSHTANEFIYKDEIRQSIETYIKLIMSDF